MILKFLFDMKLIKWVLVINVLILNYQRAICGGVQHWTLNASEKKIIPLLTSPYYLRNPNDLISFLNQSIYKKRLDSIMEELIAIKSNLTHKMSKLDLFTNELTSLISCIPNYYLDETDLYSTILNKNYLYRINYKGNVLETTKNSLPKCTEFLPLDFSMFTFEHLTSMKNRHKLKMEPEESLGFRELGISSSNFPYVIHTGLKNNPNSWKLYTLSSYYWRFKGNAKEAVECARRAILLAPRKFKDIPLLSLATILQRSNYINDSVIIFGAAVEHSPNVPENQLGLGYSLMMLSKFNKSLECFNTAQKLDNFYLEKVNYIKKSIDCFRELKIVLLTMESLLDEILPGLEKYGTLKKDFEDYHEKLDREQVPLTTRIFDEQYENQKNNLIHRSQICTTRLIDSEPVLVCDFISDIQMVMQDFAIDILNNYVELKKELIETYKVNSLGIYKKITVENFAKTD